MNKYFLSALVALFAVSLGGNAYLWNERDDALSDLATVTAERNQAKGAAETCSRSVESLETAAQEAAATAAPLIVIAKKEETARQTKAQVILATPPSKPGDDYTSAKERAIKWLEGWTE